MCGCARAQTPDFVAKKGSIVIPSLWASCRNGYANGDEFLPERFAPDREDTWAVHLKVRYGVSATP